MWEDEKKEYVELEYGCLKYIGMVMPLLPTSVSVCKQVARVANARWGQLWL